MPQSSERKESRSSKTISTQPSATKGSSKAPVTKNDWRSRRCGAGYPLEDLIDCRSCADWDKKAKIYLEFFCKDTRHSSQDEDLPEKAVYISRETPDSVSCIHQKDHHPPQVTAEFLSHRYPSSENVTPSYAALCERLKDEISLALSHEEKKIAAKFS
ncbi:uncharacterized protein I206_107018 [Kwoniella pini CBS 10737]|uniref:Uncharacterized protein n=1 Tax=Kwoniella pini CBS 10737 TaxID=1296096 RepID=A0A1B9HZE1_9TREE|nr:uncharacterized protein I206_05439 [Kwoniella pini CBS 10737]OCF48659.1 hypothetical protein I206_05439 [Kwoniella pini CBS 10737]